MMNKNRKIIAFICAISMIFTVFGAFTVNAGAADITKGIVLEYDKNASTTQKAVINAKYVGMDTGITSFQINMNVPDGVTAENIAVETELSSKGWMLLPNLDANGIYHYGGTAATNTTTTDNIIAKFTIDLTTALSSNYTVKLQAGSTLANEAENLKLNDGTLTEASAKILADPSAEVVEPLPKPPTNPDVSLPETKDPVDVQKGILLERDNSSTAEAIVINAKYVGMDTGITSFQINMNVPDGVTAENIKVDTELSSKGWMLLPNLDANGVYHYGGTAATNTTTTDNIIAKITISLSSALTDDYIAELQAGSTLANESENLKLNDNTLPAAWVKLPAQEVVFDNKMPLITEGDNKGLVDAPSGALSENAYAALEVKKADGTPATYGEDYVAYYKGEKLTKEQLDNLLAGLYCDESTSLIDMLKDVELHYNKGITGTLQIVDGEDVVVNGDTPSDAKPNTTPAPTSAPAKKAIITQANVTVKVNQVAVISPVLKINNKEVKNATFDFDYSEKPAELGENATDEEKAKYKKDKDAYDEDKEKDKTYFDFVGDRENVESAKITGIKYISNREIYIKVHSVPEGTVLPDGIDSVADITGIKVKVSVSKATSTGGGSGSGRYDDDDDNDSSSGPIAGQSQQGANPNLPNNVGNYYIDTDATPWAEYAINGLTAKGLLTGYGDRIFKPNNNVTRAEFATMLINIFKIPTNTSGESFADVSTGDWFYTAVQSCAAVGVVSGYGNGYFDPNRTIDRQEMASMVYRAARNCGKSDYIKPIVAERVFADEYQIADYAKEAVKVLQMAGVISGMSETEYCPIEKATRAQAAVMLYPFSN